MNNSGVAKGLKVNLFGRRFRLWKYGFEWQKGFRGRVWFFWWAPHFGKWNDKK